MIAESGRDTRFDPPAALAAEAAASADAAVRAAYVEIRILDSVADLELVRRLFEQVWRTDENNPPVPADLMVALRTAGSYVSGAFEGDRLVGASVGFFSAPELRSLHSHIAGVLPQARGRHVGFALKVHQRAWCIAHGAAEIAWTYDPLIARNAHFNLGKLGAGAVEYLPDLYGPIDDGINRRDPSDRLLVRWRLDSAETAAACRGERRPVDLTAARSEGAEVGLDLAPDGGPALRETDAATVLVGVPADIEAMRMIDPTTAASWRHAVRDVLGGLLADGGRVRGFDRTGWYVVDRTERTPLR